MTIYTDPIITAGEHLCRDTKEKIDGEYLYTCLYCSSTMTRRQLLMYPMRRINHTRGCEWEYAWLKRRTV